MNEFVIMIYEDDHIQVKGSAPGLESKNGYIVMPFLYVVYEELS